jgi:succinyl-CoA synthetase beta subunit
MQLTEHSGKSVLQSYGLRAPRGIVCVEPEEAVAAQALLGGALAVKSQARTWHRGNAGLVVKCGVDSSAGDVLVAVQDATKASGLVDVAVDAEVPCLIEEWLVSDKELYLALLVHQPGGGITLLASARGGVDVESNGSVVPVPIPISTGPTSFHVRRLIDIYGLDTGDTDKVKDLLDSVYRALIDSDARLIEVNPLTWSERDGFVAADVKFVVDDNALGRQPRLVEMYERDGLPDVSDLMRLTHDLEYVGLGGDIGLISGGAGMTMAVTDLILTSGGSVRGAFDCSHNSTVDGYLAALKYFDGDSRTKAILINIVGGGTRVDLVAESLVAALAKMNGSTGGSKPIVIRLEGTNAESARSILAMHELVSFEHLEMAVSAVVEAASRQ